MLANYENFLEILNEDLQKIFEHQSEYIFCKAGCSLCCEKGEYPLTRLEFEYLKKGYETLTPQLKFKVDENIKLLKMQQQKSYKCPFLIDNKCCVYKYRAIICRTFGVLTKDVSGETVIPFCCREGLNYSAIYDTNKQSLSFDLYKKRNFKSEPKPFALNNENIMNLDLAKELKLEFGEVKRLIDWF